MINIAAIIACLVLLGLAIFQFLLVLKFPLGNYAWGGYNTVLPNKLRIASAVSIILYAIFSLIILEKSEITNFIQNDSFSTIGTKALTVYFLIGIIMNGVSRSKRERFVMTPIVFLLFLTFLIVLVAR